MFKKIERETNVIKFYESVRSFSLENTILQEQKPLPFLFHFIKVIRICPNLILLNKCNFQPHKCGMVESSLCGCGQIQNYHQANSK